MDPQAAQGYIEEVNSKLDAVRLLELIGYFPEKIQVSPNTASIKAFCPVHKDTKFRSLVIETDRNTYQCTLKSCPCHSGGVLVELYAQAKSIEVVTAAREIANVLSIGTNPLWGQLFSAKAIEEGKVLAAAGDFEGAMATYQRAMAIDPDLDSPVLAVAELQLSQGDPFQAAETLTQAVELRLERNNFEGAQRLLDKAVDLLPGSEDIFFLQVRLAEVQGDIATTVSLLRDLAASREATGRGVDNEGVYRQIIELLPDDPEARFDLARFYESRRQIKQAFSELEVAAFLLIRQGKGPEAAPHLERILKNEPMRHPNRNALVEIYREMGELEKAQVLVLEQVGIFLESQDTYQAEQVVKKWLTWDPDNVEIREALARIYQEVEKVDEACEELLKCAEILKRQEFYDQEITFLFRVKFLKPEDLELRRDIISRLKSIQQNQRAAFELLDLSEVYFAKEMAQEAEAILEEAIKVDPDPTFQRQVAENLLERGREQAARDILISIGRQLELDGDLSQALECLSKLHELAPDDLVVGHSRARLLWKLEDPSAAEFSVQLIPLLVMDGRESAAVSLLKQAVEAITLPDATARALFFLAAELEERDICAQLYWITAPVLRFEDPNTAFAMAQALVRVDPANEPAQRDLADLGAEAGRIPESVNAYMELSRRLAAREDYKGALEDLRRAEAIDPRRCDVLLAQIDLLSKMSGVSSKAVLDKRRQYLVQIKLDPSMTPEALLGEYEAFLANHPDDRFVLREFAELHARLGHHDEATARFRKMLEAAEARGDLDEIVEIRQVLLRMEPDDPMANANLAVAYEEIGEIDQALIYFAKGAQFHLKNSATELAEALISRGLELDADSTGLLDLQIQIDKAHGDVASLKDHLWVLARALYQEQRKDTALARLVELRTLAQDWIEPLELIAEIQEELGDLHASGTLAELARRYEADGLIEKAIACYRRICSQPTPDLEALREWGRLAELVGADEEKRNVSLKLAEAMVQNRQWNEARRALARLDQLDPQGSRSASLHARLGEALVDDPTSATYELRTAAAGYARANELDEAMRVLRLGLDRSPDDPESCALLAELLDKDGQSAEASRVLTYQIRGKIRRGHPESEVQKLFELLLARISSDPELLIYSGKALVSAGQKVMGARFLELAVEAEIDDPFLLLDAVDIDAEVTFDSNILRKIRPQALLDLGRYEEAIDWCRSCISRLTSSGQADEAIEMAMVYVSLDPGDYQAHLSLGELLESTDRQAEAHDSYLAAARILRSQPESAAQTYEIFLRAVKTQPGRSETRVELAEYLVELGKSREAADAWLQAAKSYLLSPDSADLSGAIKALEASLQLHSRSVDAARLYADCLYRREGFTGAANAYRSFLKLVQETGTEAQINKTWREVAALEVGQTEIRAGFADWLLTGAGKPEEAKSVYTALADSCVEVRDLWPKAIEFYTLASTIEPSDQDAHLFDSIAALHLKNHVFEFAAEALRESSRLYEMGQKIEEAISRIQQVIDLKNHVSGVDDLLRLGALQRLVGNKDEALATYRLAYEQAQNMTSSKLREVMGYLIELDPSDEKVALDYLEMLPTKQLARKAVTLARSFQATGNFEAYDRLIASALNKVPDSLALRLERVTSRSLLQETPEEKQLLANELAQVVTLAHEQGEKEVCSDAFERLEAMVPDGISHSGLATLYRSVGNVERAVGHFCMAAESALHIHPRDAARYLMEASDLEPNAVPAGVVAIVVRNRECGPEGRAAAERVLESALLARSRNRTLIIATALLEQFDVPGQTRLLKRILEAGGANFAVAVAGSHCDWLENRDRFPEALALAKTLTTIAGNSPDAWYLLAQMQRKHGMVHEAAQSHLTAARLFNDAGALTEEESCLQEALEVVPDNREILENLANFYQREQRVKEAAQCTRRVAEIALKENAAQDALQWLRRTISLTPQDCEIRAILADNLRDLGKSEEALDQYLELARLKAKLGKTEEASAAYENILKIEPRHEPALAYLLDRANKEDDEERIVRYTLALATIRSDVGALGQALQIVRPLQSKYPERLEILICLMDLAQRAKDQVALRTSALALGEAYLAREQPLQALDCFEKLLIMESHDMAILELCVVACRKADLAERAADFASRLTAVARDRGDARRLLTAAEALIAYDPLRPGARMALGEAYYWLDQLDKAVPEFQKAVDLYLVSDSFREAMEPLKRIIAAEPQNGSVRIQLAKCISQVGTREESRRAWIEAYTVNKEFGSSESLDEIIDSLIEFAGDDIGSHELALLHFKNQGLVSRALDEILQLVRIFIKTGRTDAADALLEEGAELDPESLTLQLIHLEVARAASRTDELVVRLQELGDRFMASGDLLRAAEVMEQALREDPHLSEIRKKLVRINLTLGQIERGIVLASEVVSSFLSIGESEEAREFAEEILSEFKGTPGLASELGELFLKSFLNDVGARYLVVEAGRSDLAAEGRLRLLERAVKARPRWADALKKLAEAQIANGDSHAAVGTLDRLCSLLLEAKQFPDAITIIRQQISLRPKDVPPRRRLVEVYQKLGDRENRADALQSLTDLFVSLGRMDEAVEAYRELTILRPDDPVVLAKFVELFAQVGNELEIIDEYVRLAEAYSKKGMLVEATQTFEQALAIDRKNADLRDKFVKFLMANGQKNRALLEMRRLAETYVRRGNRGNALNVLQNAISMNPRDPETGVRLAAAQESSNQHDEAVGTMARAWAQLTDMGMPEALSVLRDALQAFPSSILIRTRLIEALRNNQELEEAAREARAAAELCCTEGKFDEAENLYKIVSELAPESQAELRDAIHRHAYDPNLQYLDLIRLGDWLAYRGFPDKAMEEYRKARTLNDERPALIQRCIDAALQYLPEDETILDYLSLADRYTVLGQYTKARKAYDHVLRLDANNHEAKAGRESAIQAERKKLQEADSDDDAPLRPVKEVHKPRMDMGDLMDAISDES